VRVAVVGAGVNGCATARELARRGADVDLYEQFELEHTRGSSHGDARIFRISYPEAEYVALALEALPLWQELERELGRELLRPTASLDVGRDLPHSAAMDANAVEYEALTGDELRDRFGVLVPEGGIWQRDGGVLNADACRRALADSAVAAGARLHERTRIDDLEALDAEVVVVTAGAWVNRFGLDLPVRVTRETVAYFDIGRRTPTIIDWGPGIAAYALTTPAGLLKVGLHHRGHETDPDLDEGPNPGLVAAARTWVSERLALDLDPARAESCLYTTTPGEYFLLERRDRYVIGSACSGHGFKFAPAVGVRLAALALGDGDA
jgi:sarcosine oxidase